jgi:uncharacterized protein
MAAFAIGVWLVTVVGASAMDRAGWCGPTVGLLRRLPYGTTRSGRSRLRTARTWI